MSATALVHRLGVRTAPSISRVAPRDWAAPTAEAFPPLAIGPFFWVHGSHCGPPGLVRIPIRIDAGPAFGTGEHATTRGCLLALAALAAMLKRDGIAILSGIPEDRADAVYESHRQAGLAPAGRLDVEGWTTLTMTGVWPVRAVAHGPLHR